MGWCVDQEPNNSLERRTDSIEYCSDSFPTIATVSRNMTSSLMRSEAFVLRCQEKEAEVENFRRKIEKPCKENNSLHQKADALVHQV